MTTNDMTAAIAPRSDQMNAEDLLGGPRTFTIKEVRVSLSPDQPVSVVMAEFPAERPFKPSKTVMRLMVSAWGLDSSAYVGKRMTLYRDPGVRFGGQDVGGIRVSHMSGIPQRLEVALAVTRGKRATYAVDPLAAEELSPMDRLVFAFNRAEISTAADRLAYCRDIAGRDGIRSAKDLTAAEIAATIKALDEAAVVDRPVTSEEIAAQAAAPARRASKLPAPAPDIEDPPPFDPAADPAYSPDVDR